MELPPHARCVYLVRHAESERVGDRHAMDPDLTARGEAQLEVLRKHAAAMAMANDAANDAAIDAVVCSELVRARRTAEAIASVHGLVPAVDAGWNEFHTVGAWRDHGQPAIDALLQQRLYQPDDRGPIGETLRELHRRTVAAWERLLAMPGRRLLVVSHNGVLVTLVQALLGLGEDAVRTSVISYPHAAISEMWLRDRDHDPSLPGRFTVAVRIADASHLPPELVTR